MPIPVRLSAAYMEPPVMLKTGDIFRHRDAEDLPIAETLKADLRAWDAAYQATLDPADPAGSDFSSPAAAAAHRAEGAALARRLQAELGDGYAVVFEG